MRGKADLLHRLQRQAGDHPRLCGEKYKMTYAEINALRITPAYAGKRYKPAKFQK